MIGKYCYKASTDDYAFTIVNEGSDEYKKYSAIVDELIDLQTKLSTMLVGYTFTEQNWSKSEFKTKIENEIGRNVEIGDKELEYIGLTFQSTIDENLEFEYDAEASEENSTYTIEIIEHCHGIGF